MVFSLLNQFKIAPLFTIPFLGIDICKRNLNSVKMLLTRLAGVLRSSEVKRITFSSADNLPLNDEDFNNWLVGVVDGDGSFSYSYHIKKNNWIFTFEVSQSTYNLRMLECIKKNLGIGRISINEKRHEGKYRVQKRGHLIKHIIPIFDAHPLLTSKHFNYVNFREALYIAENPDLNADDRNAKISKLKLSSEDKEQILKNYKNPVWYFIPEPKEFENLKLEEIRPALKKRAKKVINKFWLVGFVEAEGSFFIHKNGNRMRHRFKIAQKFDKHVIWAISLVLQTRIYTETRYDKSGKIRFYYITQSTNQETVKLIIKYFSNAMKGRKSLEYRIWSKSFNNRACGCEYLLKNQEILRCLRSIRHDIFGKIITIPEFELFRRLINELKLTNNFNPSAKA